MLSISNQRFYLIMSCFGGNSRDHTTQATEAVQELSELLLHFIGKYNKVLVLGDFKIHVC